MADITDYDEELIQGSKRAAQKAAGARTGEYWMVPLENIRVKPGLNLRVRNADYEAHVEWIKDSIIANGFYLHEPIKGFVGKEDGEDVIFCVGGFTRLDAAKRAAKEGHPIKEIPLIPVPAGTSNADLILGLLNDNTGKHNTPYEKAIGVNRLVKFGWSDEEVAEKAGLSLRYIRDYLLYALGLPMELQRMIADGDVNLAYAVRKAREIGDTETLKLFKEELARQDKTDPPLGDGEDTELDQTRDRPRSTRIRPAGTSITSRVALGAFDYAMELLSSDPKKAFDFMQRWRKGEESAREELKKKMSKAKLKEEPKKRGRKPKPSDTNEPPVLTQPTAEESQKAWEEELERETRRLDKEEPNDEVADDDEEL